MKIEVYLEQLHSNAYRFSATETNFLQLCGLFNLILEENGHTIEDKLNNFRKKTHFSEEEKERIEEYSNIIPKISSDSLRWEGFV